MDLIQATDEIKNILQTAQLLVSAWEDDPDDYTTIKEHLTDLASEMKRVEEV